MCYRLGATLSPPCRRDLRKEKNLRTPLRRIRRKTPRKSQKTKMFRMPFRGAPRRAVLATWPCGCQHDAYRLYECTEHCNQNGLLSCRQTTSQTIICHAQEGQESWPRNVDLCEVFGRRGERFRLYPELMSLSPRPVHMQCVNVCTNLQHEIHTVRATEKVNSHPQLLRSVML